MAKQEHALELLRGGSNIFLTGLAGTGKTFTIKNFIDEMRANKKNVIVCAPTGIAALNAGGATVHSTFKLFGMYPNNKMEYKRQAVAWSFIDLVVIDEVSMLPPDYLDVINRILKRERCNEKPFGGVQMVLVGDPEQLPPVLVARNHKEELELEDLKRDYGETPTFLNARTFKYFETVELDEVKRQTDPYFIDLINRIRDRDYSKITEFKYGRGDAHSVHLRATNREVDAINNLKLSKLEGEEVTYDAIVEGNFDVNRTITPQRLVLKVGARVMVTANLFYGQVVNGDIGTVKSLGSSLITIVLDRLPGNPISIPIYKWEQKNYVGIEESATGSFTQYPLRLAYAITIHKSQGLSLDNVVIEVSKYVQPELLYVAVSRATSYETLFLNIK